MSYCDDVTTKTEFLKVPTFSREYVDNVVRVKHSSCEIKVYTIKYSIECIAIGTYAHVFFVKYLHIHLNS